MKFTLVVLALFMTLQVRAAAPAASPGAIADLPAGVVYTAVDRDTYESAAKRLRAAIAGGPEPLAQLMGLAASDAKVLAGPFFALEIDGDNLKGRAFLPRGKYRFPVPGEAGFVVESFSANDAAQKRFLAHYVLLSADFRGELEIRRPTFDELALIWGWVSWDLDDPLLVVESPREKFVFDFDPRTGLITWVERLTNPCFTGQQDGKAVLACHCARVVREQKKWQIAFEALASCPAPAVNSVALAVAGDSPARPAVLLPTNDEDARTDAMLARIFAPTHDIMVIPSDAPDFRHPGKPYAGAAPVTPKDAQGEPIHGYVLFGSMVNADGSVGPTRILISTDQRLSDEILRATSEWRVEPATRDGKPVTVMFWEEWPF